MKLNTRQRCSLISNPIILRTYEEQEEQLSTHGARLAIQHIVQRTCMSQGAGRVARLSLKPLKGTSTGSLVLYDHSTLHLPDFAIKISRTSVNGHDHFSPDKGTDQI
jgi:hypothetical protein